MGVDVESPIVVGSCSLTHDIDTLKRLEDAGAGAVILKSVFEEQIIFDIKHSANMYAPTDLYGSSYDYLANHASTADMERHFALIADAKRQLHIPIVGSIDCYSFENWLTYARKFEEAGCDAIELTMSMLPYETSTSTDDVERLFQNVVLTLRKSVSIPIAIKVSPYFTDMAKFMQQLSWMGISGLTMFSRMVNIDIDTDTLQPKQAPLLSDPSQMYETLRWVAILTNKLRCPLSASTGIHRADDVVKLLLAGAQTVQVSSCLYKNGLDYISQLNEGVQQWMQRHDFDTLDQFRGLMAFKESDNASMILRTQFMRYFSEIGTNIN